ncbi:DUF2690 domain-containing protein [Nonomuraea sp. H19]|uniref:DUF2690 domain-containing protein n=1 Tax=Nonomuraea sp. H19 TaxID=3452206 RepID=UPI003F8A01BC
MKLRVVATAIGAAAVALVASSPASAQALSHYDHKDPYKTGCASTARVVETATINRRGYGKAGSVKLMWSGKCKTNWIEATTPKSATGTIYVRTADGRKDSYGFRSGRTKHWGNMLMANNMCAWGGASIQWGGKSAFGQTATNGACR